MLLASILSIIRIEIAVTSQTILRFLFPILVCFLAACSTTIPSTLAHADRIQLGRVAIVGARYEPELFFEGFAVGKGRGAVKGAAQGASSGTAQWLFHCTLESGFSLTPVCIGLAPVALVGGAMVGSVFGVLKATARRQAEALEYAINESQVKLEIQGALRDQLFGFTKAATNYTVIVVDSQGPVSADDIVDYGNLAVRDIDTVLEVGVLSAGTVTDNRIPSRGFRVTLNVQARLIRASDGKQLYARVIRADSQIRSLSDWIRNDARLLLAEFEHVRNMAIARVLDDVFLVYQPLAVQR